MSTIQNFEVRVNLEYSGSKPVEPQRVEELVTNALEHCRQEGMLSDPEWEDTSCDAITCRIEEDDDTPEPEVPEVPDSEEEA